MSRTFRMNFNSDTDHSIFSPEQSPVLLKKKASFLISYQYLKLSILLHVIGFLQSIQEPVARLLGVSQQHSIVLVEEDGVVHRRVSHTQSPLHHHALSGLPHPEHWHAGDEAVGVVFSCRVDSVVGSDHQGEVGVGEVVVQLVHLQHNVVRDTGLGQQHVQLPGHPAGDRVDAEPHLLALLDKNLDQLGHWVLSLSNGQSVSGHNDDAPGVDHRLDRVVHAPLGVGSAVGHGGPLAGVAESSQNHIGQRPVHGDTHDVGEDGSAGPDEAAHDCHQGVVQHETFSTESPSRVGVENGDDHRHVGTANSHGQGETHDSGQGGSGAQHGHADSEGGVHQVVGHGTGIGGQKTGIEGVTTREHQRGGVEGALQFSVGDQRSSERDPTDIAAEEEGSLDHSGGGVGGEGGVVVDVGGHAGQHCGHTDQRVKRCHQLGQVGNLDLLGDGGADEPAHAGRGDHLGQDLGVRLQQTDSSGYTARHADHTEGVTEPRGRLGRQATEGPDTAHGGGQVGHLVDLLVTLGDGESVCTEESCGWNAVEIVVLWGVGGSLEHVQHAGSDDEATEDVDE